jgi:hypothetical protein
MSPKQFVLLLRPTAYALEQEDGSWNIEEPRELGWIALIGQGGTYFIDLQRKWRGACQAEPLKEKAGASYSTGLALQGSPLG